MKRNPDDVADALYAFLESLCDTYDIANRTAAGEMIDQYIWEQFADAAAAVGEEVRHYVRSMELEPAPDLYCMTCGVPMPWVVPGSSPGGVWCSESCHNAYEAKQKRS